MYVDGTHLEDALLTRNPNPMAPGAHTGARREKANVAYFLRGWPPMLCKEIEHRRPGNTICTGCVGEIPPMPHAWLFVIDIGAVEFLQLR